MTITNGQYEITSAKFPEVLIGRSDAENLSLGPKFIVTLPRVEDKPSYLWDAVEGENDTFILKAGGDPIVELNDRLQVVLTNPPSPTKWKITPVPQQGENAYIVSTENQAHSWLLSPTSDEIQPDEPVIIVPLPVIPSELSTYPPTAIFIFKRVHVA